MHEFVEILVHVGKKYESKFDDLISYCSQIKNVSRRDVIENWFDLFQLKFRSKSEFSIQIVELYLFISTLDVHHQLSIVINNGLYDPFVSILKLRKFQGIKISDQDV
jgi:hypothetical protein